MLIKKKAKELTISPEFSTLGDLAIDDFSFLELSLYFYNNGGILRDILNAIVGKEDGGDNKKENRVLIAETLAVAILLNKRSQKCNSMQKILGIILRHGGCDVTVGFFFSFKTNQKQNNK